MGNRIKPIILKCVSEQRSGLRRWHIPKGDVFTIIHWLDHQGIPPESIPRNFRYHKSGSAGFSSGGGYDVIDKDLLGGNGSGDTRRKFERDTGRVFRME